VAGVARTGRLAWRGLRLLRSPEATVLAMALAIKALVLLFGAIAYQILLNQPVVGWRGFLLLWNQWDAPHYLTLARVGYQAEGDDSLLIVFYPLFPWLIRLVSYVTGDFREAAFLVSTVASLAAAVLLYRLAALDHPRERAIQAAFFFFIFPTSFYLHIGYTESLFLALALGSFLAARTGHWPLAGVLGAAACLARINGLILVPALAVEAYLQWRQDRRWRWEWLAIGLVGMGVLGYLALNWQVTGDPFRFLHIQRDHFREEVVMPWEAFDAARRSIVRGPEEGQTLGYQQIVFGLIALAGVIASARWLRPSYTVWMLGSFWLLANNSFPRSTMRYVLILFPLFILLAWAAERRLANVVITVWSLLFLGLFTATFVQGKWLS
jgi:4-amino-4-deoxy-L-arabinose transferase-like glycosyltransferase